MIKTISHKGKHPVKVKIIHPGERIQREWMQGHFMETARNNTLSYVGNNPKYNGGTIIDCGSHIGNHTLFFAVVCKSKQVYSFEPYVPSYEHSLENIELNDLSNVKVFNVALGDKKKKVGIDKNTESILNQIDHSGGTTQMVRLDYALKYAEFPGGLKLIKVDVDGSELILLKGAKGILAKHKPDVIIECATAEIFGNIRQFFKAEGYKIVNKSGRKSLLILNTTNTYIFKHGSK